MHRQTWNLSTRTTGESLAFLLNESNPIITGMERSVDLNIEQHHCRITKRGRSSRRVSIP
ncbi:hypothetical protein WN51_09382 [Melipona quadrifasciata]|uniref:Uncharacterized protein n=1 Tax=Melipona quadrifasciata TaxID=166423 RepID=A0A0M9A5M3_9HYME|nr:hypothetical protein WN51_09382 [Melipona quadrifasciata]